MKPIRIRIVLPERRDLFALSIATLLHVVVIAGALFAGSWSSASAPTALPHLVLTLSPTPNPQAPPQRPERRPDPPKLEPKQQEPKPDPEPTPPKVEPVRTKVDQSKNVVDKLEDTTAQPDELAVEDPPPDQGSGASADNPPTDGSEGGSPDPDLPFGDAQGTAVGLVTDQPFTADWYLNLVSLRLQDAWREKPILPHGAPVRRAVARFVIQKDGRLTDIEITIPSGYPLMDQSIIRALRSVGKLPPLPRSYDREQLPIRCGFRLDPADA